ncbi:MAG TPA: aminotransferase class I/II-fold pyridoxal phosphate-dependent enzyme [Bacteroidia bacterium]|nr:aminotransferase class I/II-fold pyridoxal phosphate-dependent enzyme [Bacteroidia bacterium]
MKNNFSLSPSDETISFEITNSNRIDAQKHTLYDVLADPRLDNLILPVRLGILSSWEEDVEQNQMSTYQRYAFNGCRTERSMFDVSGNKTVNMINFGSNDYLNMSQHPAVINAAVEALQQYGVGAGAACNASGLTKIKIDLEKEIADTFGYERALVYPSGYTANTGVLSSLLRSNDIAIVDMLAHASIMDGVADKNKMLFKHNDMRSLETVLKRVNRQYINKIVVIDGVYSMDGDIANLPEISALCKKHGAFLMVDEAHAFGVIGKNGLGILDHFDMPSDTIDILVGTLSKTVGCSGGFVTGKKELINYLRLASRPYFFTTAPLAAANAAALESIKIIREDTKRKNDLWRNINHFRSKLNQTGLNTGNAETAIFPIIMGNLKKVFDITRLMGVNGVLANGIPYPAVSRKQSRIRMTVTSEMTIAQLDKGYDVLCDVINSCENKMGEIKLMEDYDRLLTAV